MTSDIQHDENNQRYSLFREGLEAYLTYERPTTGHRHVTHTIVPGKLGGQGIGKQLVTRFMQDTLAAGETVSSSCWFASDLIEKTPEWARLRA